MGCISITRGTGMKESGEQARNMGVEQILTIMAMSTLEITNMGNLMGLENYN